MKFKSNYFLVLGKLMKKFVLFVFISFCFVACQSEEKSSLEAEKSQEVPVQIEQDDAKAQVSDTNLPLPVEDGGERELSQINSSVVSSLYQYKCATCHGKRGEISLQGTQINRLSFENFVTQFNTLRTKDANHALSLSKEQINNIARLITKEN